ncbi:MULTISPECIES: hypothetical protein [unclassified Streptomyces]|uniref:hypothetical protein n=1 Tax=unclassified Streptomyces TaxID=2593676 RepID=UPI00332DE04E
MPQLRLPVSASNRQLASPPRVPAYRFPRDRSAGLGAAGTAAQTEIIARALISYLLAVSTATENDVLPLLGHLRQAALQRGSDPSV